MLPGMTANPRQWAAEKETMIKAKKLFDRLLFGQKFDSWAEEQTLISARVLNQAAADILRAVDAEIAQARWRDGFDTARFLRNKVVPITREVTEPLAVMLIEDANKFLAELVDLKLQWSRTIDLEPETGTLFEGVGDVAAAAVPIGVGAATAAGLPFMAVSTTAVLFGFLTVTTISWPIVAAGSAVAALGVATGAVQTSKLWSRMQTRMRKKSQAFVVAVLLKGRGDQLSLLERLTSEFQNAAQLAREI